MLLRRPAPGDIALIDRLHRDPVACAHNPGDMLGAPGEAAERFRAWDEHWRRHGFGYHVVCADDGTAVGFCGLKVMRLAGRDVRNLFYRLDPAVWGRGLATRAATTVVAGADGRLPVVARVRPANAASARVAIGAGLERAPHLDTAGEDGPDEIYARNW